MVRSVCPATDLATGALGTMIDALQLGHVNRAPD